MSIEKSLIRDLVYYVTKGGLSVDMSPWHPDQVRINNLTLWSYKVHQLVDNRLKEIGINSKGWDWQISQKLAHDYVKSIGCETIQYPEVGVSVENGALIISAATKGDDKLKMQLEGLLMEIIAPHIRNLADHGVTMMAEFVSDLGFVKMKVTRHETPDNKPAETEN